MRTPFTPFLHVISTRAVPLIRGAALIAAAVIVLLNPGSVRADNFLINFETYATGSVNGQDGWSSTGAAGAGCALYDHAISGNTTGIVALGAKSLRISNAVTSGCFSDQTFSRSLANEAGESSAESNGLSGGTRQRHFEAQWDFASTVPGAEQPGLSVVASPDRGDGARMSWIQMADTPGGLAVNFYDYQHNAGDFVFTSVASNLARNAAHTIRVTMDFVDGPANDVVRVYVDGTLRHTGTSWEDYFRDWESNPSRTVDSILFRTGGTAAPATAGYGFLIDNMQIMSSAPLGACAALTTGSTITLLSDCTTSQTILVPAGFTLDGAGYTLTAVDPPGGHFLGAIVKNAGTTANVRNLTVTTAGLTDACDSGNDRLRGILFEGAAGAITNNRVLHIKQGVNSGCQEGNAIEARNAPYDTTGADLNVTISGNTISDYQKNGITASGSVAATITNNTVTGAGAIDYIAQNGIQVSYGATANMSGNTVSGNNYTPAAWLACGILYYQADGVKASKNVLFANERDQCNIGRGGGNFNPAP